MSANPRVSIQSINSIVNLKDLVGNETKYTYDDYGRVSSETRPDGGVTTYAYNSDNTIKTITRRDGKTVSYSYDAVKRPVSQSVDGDTISYTYDADGNILSATNSSGTVSFAYDATGKLIKETQNGIDITTSYDSDSNVKMLSFLGQTVSYTRDNAGLATQVGDIAFTYDANSIQTQIAYPNSTNEQNTFDAIYNIKKIETANQTLNYTQDKTGLITSKNDIDYTYDNIGRLIQAGSDTFTYDKAGNNLNNSAVYNTLNNQMQENALYAITYDAMGNIASKYNKLTKETSKYTFNARNQLTQYVQQDENNQTVKTLNFTYDAFGRRASKTEDNITQKYLYDGDDIIAILDGNNQVITTITHDESIDTPLSITNANGTFYYHRDHQGSIVSLTDSTGAVVESFTYDTPKP
jgi:YD repeat-containing protein